MVHSQYSSVQTELHWVPSEAIASLAPSKSTLVLYRPRAVTVCSLPVAAIKVMTHIRTSVLALTITLDIHFVCNTAPGIDRICRVDCAQPNMGEGISLGV